MDWVHSHPSHEWLIWWTCEGTAFGICLLPLWSCIAMRHGVDISLYWTPLPPLLLYFITLIISFMGMICTFYLFLLLLLCIVDILCFACAYFMSTGYLNFYEGINEVSSYLSIYELVWTCGVFHSKTPGLLHLSVVLMLGLICLEPMMYLQTDRRTLASILVWRY